MDRLHSDLSEDERKFFGAVVSLYAENIQRKPGYRDLPLEEIEKGIWGLLEKGLLTVVFGADNLSLTLGDRPIYSIALGRGLSGPGPAS